jgi:glycosyltransferase involved in cell wall biosynthesis
LERLARELLAIPGTTINCGADERVALKGGPNYFVPAKDAIKTPADGVKLGLYTHGDNGLDIVPDFDVCIAMNRRMADRLPELGARKVALIRPGAWPAKQIVFGVAGRVYNSGRKGEGLVAQAIEAGFNFIACKSKTKIRAARQDWPCPASAFDADDEGARRSFYASIDYFVVTSLDEGGPMTVPEAIACGVPVIAPDVGWCWEFPVLKYARGDWDSLRSVLRGLTDTPTWSRWVEAHRRLFADLQEQAA